MKNVDMLLIVCLFIYTQKPVKDHTKVPVLGGEASFTTDSGENSSLGSCSLGKMSSDFLLVSQLCQAFIVCVTVENPYY